ncbi:BRISC and BRCA1-A complex member 1-like [Prorops nasuta]|uniref:BRISC and BRCA1-A complex member 1-like n=1 Tax=Prorops nasuta TaxID=863751 RepID=UPI0034CFA084
MSDQDIDKEIQIIEASFQGSTIIGGNSNLTDPSKLDNSSSLNIQQEEKKVPFVSDTVIERNLPELNLPEKILFVIDTVGKQNYTPFKLGTGAKYAPLLMIKRVIEVFLSAKSTIHRGHEYALMTIDSKNPEWICDFTNNTKTIINYLDTFKEDIVEEEARNFDLGPVFEMIEEHITLPEIKDPSVLPTYVPRVIIIYSRTNCIPKLFTGQQYFQKLTDNPYFFLDILYVHEPPSSNNLCEEVYSEIATLDTANFSYILEVGRNAAKLHDNMIKLMAHPLQRPLQKDASYTLSFAQNSQEVHTSV